MIGMAASVIADRAADGSRECRQRTEELLNRIGLKGWCTLQRLIQLGDIGLMMPGMMNLHGPSIDVGLKRAMIKAERGQRMWKSHETKPPEA
jgi:hypothetical protein